MNTNRLSQLYGYKGNGDENEELIRVVLIDSHQAMREGLRHMLNKDKSIKVVGEAKRSQEALNQINRLHPHIIIMDIETEGTNGIEMIRNLKKEQNSMNIIALSDKPEILAPVIDAGAVGFLTREVDSSELIAAIRIIYLWRLILFKHNGPNFSLVKL
jgi:DNA-binding NarL/FixJ family response regulator